MNDKHNSFRILSILNALSETKCPNHNVFVIFTLKMTKFMVEVDCKKKLKGIVV